jgi:hypothetical protein
MAEKTRENAHLDQPGLFDVFLSYRHHDAHRIDGLQQKIEFHGFKAFRDLDFPSLGDPSNVTPEKIDVLRRLLSRATSLIFAYSRPPAAAIAQQNPAPAGQCAGLESPAAGATTKQDSALGVWMPWELGFFDGSMMSYRIGVYLLDHRDGEPKDFKPEEYFKGCEYLQLYPRLTDLNLKKFLDRIAVRERRIDNVAGAFVWFEHLYEECLANPTNVALGVVEWYADHAAHYWRERGVESWADAFGWLKSSLDDYRVTGVRRLRSPLVDAFFDAMHAQQQAAAAMAADVAKTAIEAKGAETQAPRKEGGPARSAYRPTINPWLLFEPLFAALAPLGSGVATGDAATQAPTPGLPRGGHFPVSPVRATRA